MPSILKLIRNPYKIVCILDKLKISKLIPDKPYLQLKYRAYVGKKLNIKSPKTFNEKLNWLKLYDRKTEYTMMVDKFEAKEYVAKILGDEYIIPTLGVWDNVEDIDFDSLPNRFVLKCTHDSGGIVICKDKSKLNIKTTKKILHKALKKDFYYMGREWPYKNVKKRIIAEEYMEDIKTGELRDYKYFCFNGVAKIVFIATDRQRNDEETKFDFFDMNYNHLNFKHGHPNAIIIPEKPHNFEKMKELAEKISVNHPHLRVDFYDVNGKIYFGELTFFHHSAMVPFEPEEWDMILGDWIVLPQK